MVRTLFYVHRLGSFSAQIDLILGEGYTGYMYVTHVNILTYCTRVPHIVF